MEPGDFGQAQQQDEHYLEIARAISNLWNGLGSEEDVRLVCQAAAIDEGDVNEQQQ